MYLGIDLGTSGIKAVLVDDAETVRASHTEPLDIARPQPGWSEQTPEDWWHGRRPRHRPVGPNARCRSP